MDKVVPFPADKLKTRDRNMIFRDVEDGMPTTYRCYVGSYQFDGNDWIIEVWAKNQDEAQRKMAAISAGKIDGQVMEIIPA